MNASYIFQVQICITASFLGRHFINSFDPNSGPFTDMVGNWTTDDDEPSSEEQLKLWYFAKLL